MSDPVLNQPWEDVASDVTGAIEKAVQPLLKRAVDDIYAGLLDTTQDYLTENLAFNIASRIDCAEREAASARARITQLEAEKAEAVAALKPFADKAGQFSQQGDGSALVQMDFAYFRAARTTLSRITGEVM